MEMLLVLAIFVLANSPGLDGFPDQMASGLTVYKNKAFVPSQRSPNGGSFGTFAPGRHRSYKYPGETKKSNGHHKPNVKPTFDVSPEFDPVPRNVPMRNNVPKPRKGPYGPRNYPTGFTAYPDTSSDETFNYADDSSELDKYGDDFDSSEIMIDAGLLSWLNEPFKKWVNMCPEPFQELCNLIKTFFPFIVNPNDSQTVTEPPSKTTPQNVPTEEPVTEPSDDADRGITEDSEEVTRVTTRPKTETPNSEETASVESDETTTKPPSNDRIEPIESEESLTTDPTETTETPPDETTEPDQSSNSKETNQAEEPTSSDESVEPQQPTSPDKTDDDPSDLDHKRRHSDSSEESDSHSESSNESHSGSTREDQSDSHSESSNESHSGSTREDQSDSSNESESDSSNEVQTRMVLENPDDPTVNPCFFNEKFCKQFFGNNNVELGVDSVREAEKLSHDIGLLDPCLINPMWCPENHS